LPDYGEYQAALKQFGSATARQRRLLFQFAAFVIIGTHVIATILASLLVAGNAGDFVSSFLAVELLLLVTGLATHQFLHSTHSTRRWAYARLVAEVSRSVRALKGIPGRLDYLFMLPLPESFMPVLRTLDVLHLNDVRLSPAASWKERSVAYDEARLAHQRDYYLSQGEKARLRAAFADRVFSVMSVSAVLVTLVKLVMHELHGHDSLAASALTGILKIAAMIFPVVSVAAVSLSAAFDLTARAHVYESMRRFLAGQLRRLKRIRSETELAIIARESEARLLGETANWYARRFFTSVS